MPYTVVAMAVGYFMNAAYYVKCVKKDDILIELQMPQLQWRGVIS
jgi:hypothetical protein